MGTDSVATLGAPGVLMRRIVGKKLGGEAFSPQAAVRQRAYSPAQRTWKHYLRRKYK